MPGEQQSPRPDRASPPAGRESRLARESRRGARRAADRHYLTVVAAEARRLARQLCPPNTGAARTCAPIRGAGAELLP
jgi:hypothetical protein